jgi:cytochrome c oxidase subunit IV
MENSHSTGGHSAAHGDEHSFDTKAIWRTFWILLVITVVELVLAVLHYSTGFPPKLLLNGVFAILTLAKAFYIVAEFMHLRHEIKNMIMTIAVPALLFLWFLGAFLWDGDSYRNLRNRYDRHYQEQSTPAKSPEGHGEQKPGELH